jgi:hypothetical protein
MTFALPPSVQNAEFTGKMIASIEKINAFRVIGKCLKRFGILPDSVALNLIVFIRTPRFKSTKSASDFY